MNFRERYRSEIDLFFTHENPDYPMHDADQGHTWVVNHGEHFQTLTVEPPEGGQYEIAVRFPLAQGRPDESRYKYSGYIAVCDDDSAFARLRGVNTGGH